MTDATPAAQLKQAADKPEDFGHEPMDVYANGKLRTVECLRCRMPWPCATAVVLGITAREVAR